MNIFARGFVNMQNFKSTVKQFLSLCGIFLTRNQRYDYLSQKVYRKLLRTGSNCVDIGCHKGEVLRELLKLAPNGIHYGFEPIPGLFNQYMLGQFPDNCRLFNLGLSSEKREKSFHFVRSNPAYSGFRKRSLRAGETVEIIQVQTDCLDNILSVGYCPDLIKIDVEGAELEVLKGSLRTLTTCSPAILFEHGKGASDHYGTTPGAIFQLLCRELGYSIFTLQRFLQEDSPLNEAEFSSHYESGTEYYFIALKQ